MRELRLYTKIDTSISSQHKSQQYPKRKEQSNIPHSEHIIVSLVENVVACECLDAYKNSDVKYYNDSINDVKLKPEDS